MAKVKRSFRLPVGLNNKLEDMAQGYDCTVTALVTDALRRALISYDVIPFYRIKTVNQLNHLAKAIRQNSDIFRN
jgi:hypothetical protein